MGLAQDLPLYLHDDWAWELTAVWAPAPSDGVTVLLEGADAAALSPVEDLGLRVLHARIELAR